MRFTLFLLSIALAIPFSLPCEESVISIESNKASYRNKEIALEGEVSIEHSSGRVTARRAHIKRKGASDTSLQEIELHDDVVLSLDQGGLLKAGHAFLNGETFQGRFSAGSPDIRVHYQEQRRQPNGLPYWLSLDCERMDIELARSPNKRSGDIRQVTALGDVTIAQEGIFQAKADRVIYLTSHEDSPTDFFLELADPNWWRNHTAVATSPPLVACDIPESYQESLLTKANAPGQLLVRLVDRPCELIILRGHVELQHREYGSLSTDESLYILRTQGGGKRAIDRVTSTGTTVLHFCAEEIDSSRTLACYGRVILDQERRHASFLSPIGIGGRVDAERQIHYSDGQGEVFADEMEIAYTSLPLQLDQVKVTLQGNVRLLNRHSLILDHEGEGALQLGMADRLTYWPGTERMTLEASPGKRVLFIDESQDHKVSARKIHFDRKHRSVEGVGNVRFSLSDKELGSLRNYFTVSEKGE